MRSTAEPHPLTRQALRSLRQLEVAPGSGVLVGVSGGPDSTALLQVLLELAPEHPLRLQAAHLDHGLRGRSEREEEQSFLTGLCDRLGVVLVREALPEGALREQARRSRRSLEETAREARYAFLRRAAADGGFQAIAVGHTADDQAETMIMQFFAGGGAAGPVGMAPRAGQVVRPLIRCSREQVLDYLGRQGLDFCTDSSNRDRAHLRNAVRLELVPAIARLFPGYRRSLCRLAGRLQAQRSFLEEEASHRLAWRRAEGGCRMPLHRFLGAPAPLRVLSLLRLLRGLPGSARRVSLRFLRPAAALCGAAAPPGRVILDGYGVRLSVRGPALFLETQVVRNGKKGYLMLVKRGQDAEIPEVGLSVRAIAGAPSPGEGAEGSAAEGGGSGLAHLGVPIHLGGTSGPVVVRSARPDDRVETPRGTRSVGKLLSQWRVPPGQRWKVPIVADRRGTVAVLGRAVGFRNQLRAGTSGENQETLTLYVDYRDVEGK